MGATTLPEFSAFLPAPRTRLIGREAERALARAALLGDAVPLLTLTGPGGVGKTRLALAIAGDIASHFAEGIVWVDFSSLADSSLVPATVARALNLVTVAGLAVDEQLARHLRSRQTLLLLDNCEHMLPAVATLVSGLLTACPALQVLATSRAPLHVRGEQVLPVQPLPLPGGTASLLESVARSEAVLLFVERARAVRPAFSLDETNSATIAAICQRLDGLPLAIELAAARVRVFSPDALLDEMSDRPRVLTDGPRDLPARQQTIRDTIAWSHDLLDPGAQRLFRRLAVFSGGWTMDAVEAVAGEAEPAAQAVISGMTALVDQSLVRRGEGSGDARFTMLETIRDFALARLAESGEASDVRARHAGYFRDLVAGLDLFHSLPGDQTWMPNLLPEQDNLRLALSWFAEQRDGQSLNNLSGALFKFWLPRDQVEEGSRWLAAAIAHDSDDVAVLVRSRVYSAAGFLALLFMNDFVTAKPFLDRGLLLAREAGEPMRLAEALLERGVLAFRLGDFDMAETLYRTAEFESRRIVAIDASSLMAGIAFGNLANLALVRGDDAGALANAEEAVRLQRLPGGTWGLSIALAALGSARLYNDDVKGAARALVEGLALTWLIGDRTHLSNLLRRLAGGATHVQQTALAFRLLDVAVSLDVQIGPDMSDRDRDVIAWCSTRIEADPHAAALAGDRDVGAVLSVEEALDLACDVGRIVLGNDEVAAIWAATGAPALPPASLGIPGASPRALAVGVSSSPPEALSPREQEVLRFLCQRLTDPEIAERLFLSPRTVESHVSRILGKLGASNRRDAAAVAVRCALV